MLVNDKGFSTAEPNSGPAGSATLDDYKSWRRLAVAVRSSVIRTEAAPGSIEFMYAWADDPSIIQKGYLVSKADPSIDDLVYPKVPMLSGTILAMGGAKVFTDKVSNLVAYVTRGNDIVPEDEGTYALKQARSREAKGKVGNGDGDGTSALKVFAIGVGTAATAGLVVFAVTEILRALKGKD